LHCCFEHVCQYFWLPFKAPGNPPFVSRTPEVGWMLEPREIEDRPDELAVTRVAAVDVAKASGVVCTRVPREGEPGRFVTKVHTVGATTNAILELAGHLAGLQIEKVVLESTSDYVRREGA
jgi:hypothetical protein